MDDLVSVCWEFISVCSLDRIHICMLVWKCSCEFQLYVLFCMCMLLEVYGGVCWECRWEMYVGLEYVGNADGKCMTEIFGMQVVWKYMLLQIPVGNAGDVECRCIFPYQN